MFSKLSKGYGSWNAGYVDPYFGEKRHREHTLPDIDQESHCHGVTVGPHSGRTTAMSWATHKLSREQTSDSLPLPKTYTTRRGALQIYVGPEDAESEEEDEGLGLQSQNPQINKPSGQELIDLSLKLGTMDRLVMSVLQFGDQEYDHEHSSISDEKNKAFLKFLHSVDNGGAATAKTRKLASSVQPGGDLNSYLKELRSSSSMRYFSDGSTYIPKSRESMELQAILRGLDNSWPLSFQQDGFSDRGQTPGQFTRPVSRVSSRGPSPGPPSTPRSTYQVLSSKKLTASLKSGSYLGRPSSQFSAADDESDSEIGIPAHVTSASVTRRQWSPSDSQDDTLLTLRDQFYRGGDDESEVDDSKKRRRFKERSFLTGTELLSQGRNMYKVDGSHVTDVKVTGKGDGHSEGKGHGKLESVEETGEGKVSGAVNVREESAETESTTAWAENVAAVQKMNAEIEKDTDHFSGPIINIEEVADEKPRVSSARSRSRPSSNTSSSSSRSSKPAPSIISIQVSDPSKVPAKTQDKPFVGLKRRKSLSNSIYSPDKYVQQVYRQKSPKQRKDHSSETNDIEREAGESMYRNPPRVYTFGPGVMSWSVGDEGAIQATIPPDNTPDLSQEQANLSANANVTGAEDLTDNARPDSPHSDVHSLNGSNKEHDNIEHVEQEEYLKEEDLIDNIQECNREVERIEAKSQLADDSSDSGTYVDEEDMMKVIREMEKEQGIESSVRVGSTKSSDKDVNNEVEGEGQDVAVLDEVEVEKQEIIDDTVEEVYDENQSSVSRSRRSSRLSKSRKTQDQDSNEEGEDDSDEPVLQVLPPLLSEQPDEKVEQVSDEAPPPLDEAPPLLDGALSTADETPPSSDEALPLVDVRFSESADSDMPDAAGNSELSSKYESVDAEPVLPTQSEHSSITKNETIVPTDNNDKIDPSKAETSRPPSGQSESQIANNKIKTVTAVVNNEIKVVIETKSDGTVQQVIDKNKVSGGFPEVESEGNKLETDENNHDIVLKKTEAEEEDRSVKTDVETTDKSPELTRAVEGSTNSNDDKNADNIEDKTDDRGDESDESKLKQSPDIGKEKTAEKEVSAVKGTGFVDEASCLDQSGDGSGNMEEDIPLQISTAKDAHSIVSELDALGLRQPAQTAGKKKGKKEKAKGSRYVPPPPPSKRLVAPKEESKIPDHLQDLLNRQATASAENLERDLEKRGFLKDGKVTSLVDQSLSGPTLEAIGEGLTEEELELAKQILQKKIEDAKGQIDGKEPKAVAVKKKAAAKAGKKAGKKKKDVDERTEEEIERDMIRQKHDLEKQHRDKEAAELQRKIAERKKLLSMQENAAEEKQKEIREKMEQLEREADDLQRAEDEARDILADVRRKQREEREARRKADLERKKNEATERRERERKELEDKRKKESEMLEKIADAEMRRRLREEEERKAYEAERLAQEKYEEELREAQRHEEEEEERLKEMERQAEEEAMQRLIEEREDAERQRRRLMEEEEALREAERKKMEIMMEEEKKLEEQRMKIEAVEHAKREAERQRLLELRQLEQEARMKMQEEVERRRSEAMARRDYNLDNRHNIDKLRHGQGITRAWTFSYFVQWPRETYERPMGGYDPRKVVIKNPAPKKKPEVPPEADSGQPVAES